MCEPDKTCIERAAAMGEEEGEDAEGLLILQKIVELLVSGGYFRARISSLSPFDKLTGGLAWCITASNVDVDFDLFYDDDATLGYKIKVGEAIESALQTMQCPHPLQAHQIQGLDYPAVYPVVQWLIKRVLLNREKRGDQLRRYSHWRFHADYQLPAGDAACKVKKLDIWAIQGSHPPYRPDRSFPVPVGTDSLGGSTIAEYGILSEHNLEGAFAIPSQYSHLDDAEATRQKQVGSLLKQIKDKERHKGDLEEQNRSALERLLKVKESRKEQEMTKESLLLKLEKAREEVEKAGVGGIVEILLPLVDRCKAMQEEAVSFRTSCKAERKEIMTEIVKLEKDIKSANDNDDYRDEVQNTVDRDLQKLKDLKESLAKANRKFLLLRWKIDDFPTQMELMQYERSFMELYLDMQAKLRETRKYYGTYNALAEANELTSKEISLLNSINTQFGAAMTSQEGRAKFLASISDIAKGVEQKLAKTTGRLQNEQNALLALRERNGEMIALRRQYANMLKLFQDLCTSNEELRRASKHAYKLATI